MWKKNRLPWLVAFGAMVLLAAPIRSVGQDLKGYTPIENTRSLQNDLTKNTSLIRSLTSDFVQTKHMSMLEDKVISKGKFYYKQNNKVRIEYQSPFQYIMILNGGQMIVKDENKSNKINMRQSKTLQSANKVMIDCMRGTILENTDFQSRAYENKTQYLLLIEPKDNAMKALFQKIQVVLSKKDFSVQRWSMYEKGGDFTDMDFVNQQKNTDLPDALFNVR